MNPPNRTETPVLLPVKTAARLLSVSPRTLKRRISNGTVESVRVGRRILIPQHEIDRIAKEGLV